MAKTTKSGGRISDRFRDNLIIDRYDPIFAMMRAAKLRHIRSENSEDAVTWNVFRLLRQIDPAVWPPELAGRGLSLDYSVRRDKAPFPSGCESRPATVAPAGSSRSGRWR